MAKYVIARPCGHETEEVLYGSEVDRRRRLEQLKLQPCGPCRNEAQWSHVKEWATTQGLPALVGSEKQITWASEVRNAKLAEIVRWMHEVDALGHSQRASEVHIAHTLGRLFGLSVQVLSEKSASWWIDHREQSARVLLLERMRS